MRKLGLFTILCTLPLVAQQRQPVSSMQPDCMATFNFTAQSSGVNAAGTVTAGSTGTTPVIDNRTDAGCIDWLVTYSTTTTITGLSLLFQTATNLAGVPGTWSAYGGTLTSGINPNTAFAPPWAITSATGNKYPFLRMNLTSLTGAGTVSGNLYGWKRRPDYVTVTSGGGCPGTIATPCVVVGPTAAGAAPTTSPVLVAGENGAPGTVQTFRLDGAGLTPIAISAPGTTLTNAIANPTTPTGSQATAPMGTGPYLLNPGTSKLDQQPGTLAGGAFTQGPAASGAAKAGNPVQNGGVFNTTQPTVTNGQAVEAQYSARGSALVVPGVDNKSNNTVVPGSSNFGVFPCIANAAAPTWTETFQVGCSSDLAGNIRVTNTPSGTQQDQLIGNAAVLSGQQAVTGSAVALASNAARTICVKALVSNLINVFIGPAGITTATGFLLAPGEGTCLAVQNTNLISVIASTTGASVSWIATD